MSYMFLPKRPYLALLLVFSLAQSVPSRTAVKPDRILIVKSTRILSLMNGTQTLKSYKVALGSQPVGAKDRQGDHKTPEGIYSVDRKLPYSQFHRALHLSYPNSTDVERARKLGLSPGGEVEIHGLPAKYA